MCTAGSQWVCPAGHRIECIARAPLWSVGLDYRHGTGHGVGSFLCVHEGEFPARQCSPSLLYASAGPMGIHFRPFPEGVMAGMFMSDGW